MLFPTLTRSIKLITTSGQGFLVIMFIYSIKDADLNVSNYFSYNLDKNLKWNITNIWVTICMLWKNGQ